MIKYALIGTAMLACTATTTQAFPSTASLATREAVSEGNQAQLMLVRSRRGRPVFRPGHIGFRSGSQGATIIAVGKTRR